jgi:hypothetical protein
MPVVFAYHGTTQESASNIEREGFRSNANDKHWLGEGVYFFEDPSLAEWWAKNQADNMGGNAAIIKVKLSAEPHETLNMTLRSDFEKFCAFTDEYRHELAVHGTRIRGDKNKFRCKLFNIYKIRFDIKLIIAIFKIEGNLSREEKVLDSLDMLPGRKQLCVTSNVTTNVISYMSTRAC